MGNRANKAQKPPSKAPKPSVAKIEARAAAAKTQGSTESLDLEARRRPAKQLSAERPKPVEEATQPHVPPAESPKPKKDKKAKTVSGSAEAAKPKPKGNNSARAKKAATENNRAAGKSSKSSKKPNKKESVPAEVVAESSMQTAQSSRKEEKEKSSREVKSKRGSGAAPKSPAPGSTPAKADVTKTLVNGFCDATLKKGITGLRQEYAIVKSETIPTPDKFTAFVENHPSGRNRYRDVPCMDETRVKLRNHPQGYDYVHANYVTTPFSDNRFICSQAPLENTCYDFWLMVWQEESESVIMLCNFIETGKDKCARYIPMDVCESLTFQDITVTVLSMELLKTDTMVLTEKVVERKVKLQKGDAERHIAHYHWESWPDHGLPSTDLSSLVLLQRVRQTKTPIVVHCSAGIGRTGSIVAIEFVLERIIFNQPCEDMAKVLKALRNQRAFSIQTDLQYLYVHRILLRYYAELGYINRENPLLLKFLEEYDQVAANDPHKNVPVPPAPAPSPASPAQVQVPLPSPQQPTTVEQQTQQQEQLQPAQELDNANPSRW